MKSSPNIFIFDVYGTLFDVYSVAEKCNQYFPEQGNQISKIWRDKQIEYANLRQIMGNYENFYTITQDALNYAVKSCNKEIDEKIVNELMGSYLYLTPYSEVKEVLTQLKNKKIIAFSNGTNNMIKAVIENSEISSYFNEVISADEVREFKPSVYAYDYVTKRLNIKPEDVLFMSSNGWDISGAKNYGFQTAWINRKGLPTEELNLNPDAIYKNLAGILEWL